ncbi:nuclear transport factor 2 family protein [Streptomyces sp. CC208A]|uniref:nuclear transport factor 2 family protein n=1 Tax=Streptomyces sp. CC208A TaxID=3044573 RepID=UPI0024A9A4CD|nr:nuclear transport factor 2 family protein [Streptomyces sp. CC208A]
MTTPQHPDVTEAIARERRLHDPAVRLSRPLAEALFDPDFIEVGASGRRWTYEEMLAALPELHGGEDGPPITAGRFAGTVLAPGIVHLTYETVIDGRHARRSSVWRRDPADTLRLYYHQGTPVPEGTAHP